MTIYYTNNLNFTILINFIIQKTYTRKLVSVFKSSLIKLIF